MLNAFNYGDVLITMGTGKLLQIEEEDLGLASEHDYAVIDMKESEGMQLFLVKNPWSEGTVWKGPLYRGNALGNNEKRIQDLCITKTQTNASTLGPKPGLDSELLPPGMFWMSLHDVFQSFDSIYLNWNPSLFSYKEDVHFDWDLTKDTSPEGSFVSHPQYEVRSSVGDTVWLLLSRHFTSRAQPLNIDGDINSALEDSEHGFISLYAFDSGGQRVFLKEDATVRGPYVDSPNTLLKLEVPANRAYTVVISEQGLPQACCTFTLSAFSLAQLSLTMAREKYTHATLHHGMWTDSTAGGNASSCSYHINPQFSLRLAAPSAVCLLLETTGDDFPVHVKLVWANGNQIHSISSRDIVGDSGEYRKGCALAEIDNVQAGIYTAVCSTFEQGQRGNFTLRVNTMSACAVERIPVAAAGRFVTTVQSALFPPGSCLISASLISPRLNRVSLSVQSRGDGASGKRSTKSPLSLALHQGRSSSKRILAISGGGGEYLDGHAGFRTPDVDIQPSVFEGTECVVVIKRPECLAISVAEYVDVEVFSDGPLEVGEWKHEVG